MDVKPYGQDPEPSSWGSLSWDSPDPADFRYYRCIVNAIRERCACAGGASVLYNMPDVLRYQPCGVGAGSLAAVNWFFAVADALRLLAPRFVSPFPYPDRGTKGTPGALEIDPRIETSQNGSKIHALEWEAINAYRSLKWSELMSKSSCVAVSQIPHAGSIVKDNETASKFLKAAYTILNLMYMTRCNMRVYCQKFRIGGSEYTRIKSGSTKQPYSFDSRTDVWNRATAAVNFGRTAVGKSWNVVKKKQPGAPSMDYYYRIYEPGDIKPLRERVSGSSLSSRAPRYEDVLGGAWLPSPKPGSRWLLSFSSDFIVWSFAIGSEYLSHYSYDDDDGKTHEYSASHCTMTGCSRGYRLYSVSYGGVSLGLKPRLKVKTITFGPDAVYAYSRKKGWMSLLTGGYKYEDIPDGSWIEASFADPAVKNDLYVYAPYNVFYYAASNYMPPDEEPSGVYTLELAGVNANDYGGMSSAYGFNVTKDSKVTFTFDSGGSGFSKGVAEQTIRLTDSCASPPVNAGSSMLTSFNDVEFSLKAPSPTTYDHNSMNEGGKYSQTDYADVKGFVTLGFFCLDYSGAFKFYKKVNVS